MILIFSDHPLPLKVSKSIFLAGPSPRNMDVHDWRNDALTHLTQLGFDGEVFIPIPEKMFYGISKDNEWTYMNQIQWECDARSVADAIVFWVPRDIKNGMPGFTTNIEFGEDLDSGKIYYGRPPGADKCRYFDERFKSQKVHDNLFWVSGLSCGIKNLMLHCNIIIPTTNSD